MAEPSDFLFPFFDHFLEPRGKFFGNFGAPAFIDQANDQQIHQVRLIRQAQGNQLHGQESIKRGHGKVRPYFRFRDRGTSYRAIRNKHFSRKHDVQCAPYLPVHPRRSIPETLWGTKPAASKTSVTLARSDAESRYPHLWYCAPPLYRRTPPKPPPHDRDGNERDTPLPEPGGRPLPASSTAVTILSQENSLRAMAVIVLRCFSTRHRQNDSSA